MIERSEKGDSDEMVISISKSVGVGKTLLEDFSVIMTNFSQISQGLIRGRALYYNLAKFPGPGH